MTNFNIHNSKVEQISDTGNNYKLVSDSGNNAISEKGNLVQTEGAQNKVHAGLPKENLLSLLWAKLTACWKWMLG
jgi:hypothetical protein